MSSADAGMLHLPVLTLTDAQSGSCLAIEEFDFNFLSPHGSMTPAYLLEGCSNISKQFRRSLTVVHAGIIQSFTVRSIAHVHNYHRTRAVLNFAIALLY